MDSTLEPGTATRTHSPLPIAISEKEPVSSNTENHPKALEAGVAGNQEPDVIIVGWDGPDDVDNPKKYVRYAIYFVTPPDYICSAVGQRGRSGWSQQLFPLTHSSLPSLHLSCLPQLR